VLSEHRLQTKPNLIVIVRDGDPVAVLAFAARTEAQPVEIVALTNILQRRLLIPVGRFELFPSSFGLTLVVVLGSPKEASQAVQQLDSALSTPIDPRQLDEATLDQVRSIVGPAQTAGPGDAALADCSGELVVDAKQLDSLKTKAKLRDAIERVRLEFHSQNNARFAYVGRRDIALSVERTLGQLQPWPMAKSSGALPIGGSKDSVSYSSSKGKLRRLSIAWRVDSAARAAVAARVLRFKGSPFLTQMSSLDVDWKIDMISAIARGVGACLRIDLSIPSDATSISVPNLETTTRLATSESRIALETATTPNAEYLDIIAESDPRLAARRTAWYSLSTPESVPRMQLNIHVRTSQTDSPALAIDPALHAALASKAPPVLDFVYRMEAGQGEQWMLLASPCGTAGERSNDAGSGAAWAKSIARRYSGHLGVTVEPWLAPDGLGFIAHSSPINQAESSQSLAARLGNALGSIVTTGSVTGAELATAREDALLRIGPTSRRAWWLLVDALSPNRPSLLEPLGSFDSIRNLDLAALRASRMKWLRGPLRVGTLLNRGDNQLVPLNSALHRWLDPHRGDVEQCAQLSPEVPKSSDIQLSTKSLDPRDASVYVAVFLAPELPGDSTYERWLMWLLSRPSGWFEQTLIQPGILDSVAADIRGPSGKRALIMSLTSSNESKLSDAVLRLRALLLHLAEVGATAAELDLTQSWSKNQIQRAEIDPRRRLVDLWRGKAQASKPLISGFSQYLNRSFASAPVTVLRVHRPP